MRVAVLILFTLSVVGTKAQDDSTIVQSKGWNPRDSFHRALARIPGFRLGFDSRNSVLAGLPVGVNGFRYGLDYGKVALWTGYYSSRLLRTLEADTVNQGFEYTSSTLEYYVHQSWRFELVTSFQAGLGRYWDYQKSGTGIVRQNAGYIVPLEMGLGGTVRFLRYFGFYAGIGIRVTPFNPTAFNGPYWSYGLTYFTGTMYRDSKKLMKKLKR
jgi:hypothetical protein